MTKTHILHLYCEPEPAVSTAAARKGYHSSQMIDITRQSILGSNGMTHMTQSDCSLSALSALWLLSECLLNALCIHVLLKWVWASEPKRWRLKASDKLGSIEWMDRWRLAYCRAQVQVQVRWRSGEGQVRVRKVQVRLSPAQRLKKLKDLDLSYTLFLVFTTLHTNFFLGWSRQVKWT